ncbi:MAG: zinc ABC transporter substrate-binding protein [Acidimicrobiales bacterium]|nr:zinc ABC transporter substrate-binding protein [Acidimicrobiales bacterium]
MISARRALAASLPLLSLLAACGGDGGGSSGSGGERPTVVVTYAVLGAVVSEVVGDRGEVVVLMPNGTDPHEWSPSAKDVEAMRSADLIVANGLGLESNLQDPLAEAEEAGVAVFTVADHVTVRTVEEGAEHSDTEHDDAGEEHHDHGPEDPHLWMDPLTMKEWVGPFADAMKAAGADVGAGAEQLEAALDRLNGEVEAIVEEIPAAKRTLVTGHESMGYFADRYGFRLIGAVVPSITSQAEVSAGELAELKEMIDESGVSAIYTELGTPKATVDALADDAGVTVIELSTHTLPEDGTYRSFLLDVAETIAGGLR